MFHSWIKRLRDYFFGSPEDNSKKLFGFGTLEIVLIVVAVILVFGVGKIGNIGGALGKSIREFRREKDRVDDDPKPTTKDTKEESVSQAKVEGKEDSKNEDSKK